MEKPKRNFVHLHTHSEFSLLDGAARISQMVKKAKALGMPAVAISDHGNMYGAYRFYKECKKQGIKAILGCEVYVVDDINVRNHKEHRSHFLLLAKDNEGYLNLCKLNSKAWIDGFYGKPRLDYNILKKHSKGLIATTACLGGHVPHYLMKGMYDEAVKYAKKGKDIFGADFYIELQDHGMPEQRQTNPDLIKIARQLDIPLVATNDVHYINQDDAEMQDTLMCVEMKKTADDPDRLKFPSNEFYFKTADQMWELFGDIAPESLENTLKIADLCDCHPFAAQDFLPQFINPDGIPNDKYFRNQIEAGLRTRYGKITPQVKERLEHEFAVINDNGFTDYFLIVADLMKFAQDNGISVGPGRGSGAGSIIAYALDITKLDPFKYNLLFERFLHSERLSTPDFDLDFCFARRMEVVDYVRQKYGEDHVAQIITFGTLAAKAAIKDIARVFKMPYAEVDKITKPIQIPQTIRPPFLEHIFDLWPVKNPKDRPDYKDLPEQEQEKLVDAWKKETAKRERLRVGELVELYQSNDEVKKIVDMAMKVEGFPRNCSTHAAGVIVCNQVVGDVTPLQRNGEDITTQFDMKEMEELGFLKIDFLGLITLTDIQRTLDQLGKKIDFYDKSFSYDDPAVYTEIFSKGDTDAVFQCETGGFKRFLQLLKPDSIEDIIASVALYRPGPMDMIADYCKYKHNPTLTKYEHPMLEPILKTTYGQIVYQEQVMDVFRVMGGYSLGQADMVRRAMGKKDPKEMERQKQVFIYGDELQNISGALKKGVKKEVATAIFNKLDKFSGYAFNKSHAACYAYISYQTAFLKHYYYPYFMSSVLNNRVHKWDDLTYYILSI
ncbi:MAG: DNA polymerase III subunit alpha, partial [Firmicutes bacterium]|nr:DNA polymerase III subunit alpha [Bacillota bacterium]